MDASLDSSLASEESANYWAKRRRSNDKTEGELCAAIARRDHDAVEVAEMSLAQDAERGLGGIGALSQCTNPDLPHLFHEEFGMNATIVVLMVAIILYAGRVIHNGFKFNSSRPRDPISPRNLNGNGSDAHRRASGVKND